MIGIFPNLSNADYHGHKGSVSRSGLMEFKRSPYHYWAAYLNPEKPPQEASNALIFGDALHTLVLEPESFLERYIVESEPFAKPEKQPLLRDVGRDAFEAAKKRIAAQKAAIEAEKEEFIARAFGRTIIDEKMFSNLNSIVSSIRSNKHAAETVVGGLVEHSLFWIDKETGVLCKVRPDIWHDNYIADLKSTISADERSFQNTIATYGYHIQAAMQREGIRELTGKDIENFVFIVCEKNYPFCVVPYILDSAAMDKGREEFKSLLRDFKECLDRNEWPSYETKTISLPGWYQ